MRRGASPRPTEHSPPAPGPFPGPAGAHRGAPLREIRAVGGRPRRGRRAPQNEVPPYRRGAQCAPARCGIPSVGADAHIGPADVNRHGRTAGAGPALRECRRRFVGRDDPARPSVGADIIRPPFMPNGTWEKAAERRLFPICPFKFRPCSPPG